MSVAVMQSQHLIALVLESQRLTESEPRRQSGIRDSCNGFHYLKSILCCGEISSFIPQEGVVFIISEPWPPDIKLALDRAAMSRAARQRRGNGRPRPLRGGRASSHSDVAALLRGAGGAGAPNRSCHDHQEARG